MKMRRWCWWLSVAGAVMVCSCGAEENQGMEDREVPDSAGAVQAPTPALSEAATPGGEPTPQTLLEHLVSLWRIPDDTTLARRGFAGDREVEVFRIELDVTQDGRPDLLLGQSYTLGGRGAPWMVYMKRADDRYAPLGIIEFGYPSFRYFEDRSVIFAPIHAGPRTGPAYAYYHVGSDGAWEIMDEVLPWSPTDDEPLMDAWGSEGRPPMYMVPLAELLSVDRPRWQNAETGTIDASLGRLEGLVTETGDCSAERFLGGFRQAGCVGL